MDLIIGGALAGFGLDYNSGKAEECVCANEMAGRSGVTRQEQGCSEGISTEG